MANVLEVAVGAAPCAAHDARATHGLRLLAVRDTHHTLRVVPAAADPDAVEQSDSEDGPSGIALHEVEQCVDWSGRVRMNRGWGGRRDGLSHPCERGKEGGRTA